MKEKWGKRISLLFLIVCLTCAAMSVTAGAASGNSVLMSKMTTTGSAYFVQDVTAGVTAVSGTFYGSNVNRLDGSCNGYITYNLNGKYAKFSGKIVTGDSKMDNQGTGSGARLELYVYGDGKLLYQKKEISRTNGNISFNINVSGVKTLRLEAKNTGAYYCGFMYFVKSQFTKKTTGVQISKTKTSLKLGNTCSLQVTGTAEKAVWSSSNKKVATVTSKGVVKAVYPGTATIKAKVGGKTYTCKVTVTNVSSKTKTLKFQTTDGGVFIQGQSKAKVTFALKKSSANVVVKIKSSTGAVVYTKKYSGKVCKANKAYTFTWNGLKNGKAVAAGTYTVTVTAGNTTTTSKDLVIRKNEFAGGNGSKSNPFQVATLKQFQNVGKYNGYYFKQTANITGNGIDKIAGIYSADNPFTGTYDGNGYKISNFVMKDSAKDNNALFGGVGTKGTLKNITLEGIDLIGNTRSALLVQSNAGKINNCTVKNCNISGIWVAGMLCDINQESGLITNCTVSSGNIILTPNNDGNSNAAGLVVKNYGSVMDCQVDSLYIREEMSYYGDACMSGLVIYNEGKVSNCGADNTVLEATGSKVAVAGHKVRSGGICENNLGSIASCYFSGTAEANGVYDNKGIFY